MKDLESKVIQLAISQGMYFKSTLRIRSNKLVKEMNELINSISRFEQLDGNPLDSLEDIKLESGNVLMCLVNILYPLQLDLRICLDAAYDKIKDQTNLAVDEQFVSDKERDEHHERKI